MKFNPFLIFSLYLEKESNQYDPELKKVHETKQSNNAINIERFVVLLHFFQR